jgi:hypothetical protein
LGQHWYCGCERKRPCQVPMVDESVKELVMPDKSPQKPSAKKPGKSLKEKRADKKVKHQAGKRLMDS